MSAQSYCSVSTELDREKVWSLFSDIQNWVKWSDVYEGLRWEGLAWENNSSIVGKVRHNKNERIRFLIEKCEPARLVRYKGHSYEIGFASHRTIRFLDQEQGGTFIEVSYYSVGNPDCATSGATFVKWITERWIRGFGHFCEQYVRRVQ